MKIQNASSFETEDTLKEGADGVTLLKYQPKKGVIVLKLTGSLERGESYETYQSIPVEAKDNRENNSRDYLDRRRKVIMRGIRSLGKT